MPPHYVERVLLVVKMRPDVRALRFLVTASSGHVKLLTWPAPP